MNSDELNAIKLMALEYGDPIRGKILALIITVESLTNELQHVRDFLWLDDKFEEASYIDRVLAKHS